MDVVAYAGEKHGGVKPANFLDIGGGASAEVMAAGLHVILGDSQVKSVFVNVFGGITACDAVANGIVGALKTLGDEANKPLVVRLDGNNVEEGRLRGSTPLRFLGAGFCRAQGRGQCLTAGLSSFPVRSGWACSAVGQMVARRWWAVSDGVAPQREPCCCPGPVAG